MIKTQLFIGAALVIGVAVGYCLRDVDKPAVAPAIAENPTVAKTISDKGSDASLSALRARIAELERRLAEAGRTQEVAVSNALTKAAAERGPGRFDPRERMEELKKSDPARYAQITNNMAQWRQRRVERQQARLEFLSSVDTSRMSASARKTHAALQDLMAKQEGLMERLHDENLTREQRHAIMEELHSTGRELRKVSSDERTNLLEETAKSLGFEGDDVKEISATIQDVIEATDNGRGFGGPPPGGPGGPGGGFGGAGGPPSRR